MPNDEPVLDYANPGVAPKAPLWRRVVLALMAGLTLFVCLFFGYVAMDSRSFARGWKRLGNDPSVLPQLEAAANLHTRGAIVVFLIATAGWGAYFSFRWRTRSR